MSILWLHVFQRAAFSHSIQGGGHTRLVSLLGRPLHGDRVTTSSGREIVDFSITLYEGDSPLPSNWALLTEEMRCLVRIAVPAPTFGELAWLDMERYSLRFMLETDALGSAWSLPRQSTLEWRADQRNVPLRGVNIEVAPREVDVKSSFFPRKST